MVSGVVTSPCDQDRIFSGLAKLIRMESKSAIRLARSYGLLRYKVVPPSPAFTRDAVHGFGPAENLTAWNTSNPRLVSAGALQNCCSARAEMLPSPRLFLSSAFVASLTRRRGTETATRARAR